MKKITTICFVLIMFLLLFSQTTYAKYLMDGDLGLKVYIDKTPPVINIKSDTIDESYSKSDLINIIKENKEIKITTSDNIKIDYNEYYYNASSNDFNNIQSNRFESGASFSDDGYYKFISVDTSGNKTEILVLIDKTPPDVEVKFYKKGQIAQTSTEIISVAAIKKDYLSENIIEVNENEIEESQNIVQEELTNEIKEETIQAENNEIQNNEIEKEVEQEKEIEQTRVPMMAAARASTTVYNESDFRNALNNRVSNIVIGTSINFGSSLYINYAVTISPASNENAIRYNGYGSFIYVQNGGSLNLDSIVVDTRGMCNGRGITSINVQSGGTVIFNQNSIVDGGSNNTGILINSGGKAVMYSCHIVYCAKGIVVKSNGNLTFGNLGNGRNSEFWSNTTAISFESFTGTSNFNQSNIKIYNNTNGIVVESSSGKVNISSGYYYSNGSNGIISKAGTMNISGGSIYSNGNGINFGAGALNISGGSIYSNSTGVLLNSSYTGKMTMTSGSIYSNSSYAINHGQNSDGCCTILGGSVSGKIYLAQNNNYVNTNDKYPTLTITPSTYYFNRRLVKTNSNSIANSEISKITMTPNGSWYKYVNNEYIVVWKGCNVIVNRVDWSGKVIKTETINGNLGSSYSTTGDEIEGYDLIEIPSNQTGTFTEKDITVTYKYDIKNVAQVKFEDLLSGVQSAKYWFNSSAESFTGEGINFENNKIFEDYGFYKVVVINNVGLIKELTFELNKNSVKR